MKAAKRDIRVGDRLVFRAIGHRVERTIISIDEESSSFMVELFFKYENINYFIRVELRPLPDKIDLNPELFKCFKDSYYRFHNDDSFIAFLLGVCLYW